MSILFSTEILDSVKKELMGASTSVQIITAYCKESTFVFLDNCINDNVKDKRLLVRFRLDDLLKGSSDFSILETGISLGWKVFIRFDLHAKTYIVDNKRGLVGSANVTQSGLNMGNKANMEMATLVDIEPQDIVKINKLFSDAVPVNQDLIEKMRLQFESAHSSDSSKSSSWDATITSLFSPDIDTLFSHELPDVSEFSEGEYISFIDETYNGNDDTIKESLRWSNAYVWLVSTLRKNNGCLYFGELTRLLHDALITDPKPYRRDVKQMLANLLSIIEHFNMSEVIIDRPNYSQRIRLADTAADNT